MADADAITVRTGAVVICCGSCSYFAAAETDVFAICYRCYLSSAAAEAIRATTVLAITVATNVLLKVPKFSASGLYHKSFYKVDKTFICS